ncbi:MAG: hypothetical protein NTW73_00235 [Candidatus Parcubacteria bacterium]|nr:hypothetical protein [Candidatus Parcubacteria bacterium]
MAIEIPQEKKINWMFIIIILAVAVVGYLVYSFIATPADQADIIDANTLVDPNTLAIQNINLNIDNVLNNQTFTKLISHANLPLTVPKLGRPNPFVPYQ